MAEKKTCGKGRTRNYATVVYPESAPSDWQRLLSEMCIPCFISPLHDKDINPDGDLKKPHHHVLFVTLPTPNYPKIFQIKRRYSIIHSDE